jgi:hypothetical protein
LTIPHADGLPKEAVAEYIGDEFLVAGDRAIERLQDQLRPAYRAHGPDLRSAAIDLFTEFPSKRPVPTESLSFRTMGRLSTLAHQQIAPLEKAGYLDDEAKALFWQVFGAYAREKPTNAAGDHIHQATLETILERLAGGNEVALRRGRRALVRAVANLYDTLAAANDLASPTVA